MINDFINKNSLYFSDVYDLTNTVLDNLNKPNYLRIEYKNQIRSQYCWNNNFISNIEFINVNNYSENVITSIINGYIGLRQVVCYNKEFNYVIISRKDCRRSGMRFLYRGSDGEGNTANFVETEQIISFLEEENYNLLSYIQLRGSIPIKWSQPSELMFIPKVIIIYYI